VYSLTGVASSVVPHTVGSMKLAVNQLDGEQHAVQTGSTETVQCGLVLRSIGYRSTQADPDMPFDMKRGLVPNTSGVVEPGKYTRYQSLVNVRNVM
jgi:hypothetical protein